MPINDNKRENLIAHRLKEQLNDQLNADQIKQIYKSFGYNQIKIEFKTEIYEQSNTANLYLDINEGRITKIKNIYFIGNNNFDSSLLRSEIKSKTKIN